MNSGVFQCPSCKEYIGVESASCRFCGVPVDARQAWKAAADQSYRNSIYDMAGWLKAASQCFIVISAGGMVFLFLGTVVEWVVLGYVLFPVFCTALHFKLKGIETDDAGHLEAKRNIRQSALFTAVSFVFLIVGIIVLTVRGLPE